MATPLSKSEERKATSTGKSEWTDEEDEFKECVEEPNGSVTPLFEDSLENNEVEKQKVAIMRAFVEREDSTAKVTYLLLFNLLMRKRWRKFRFPALLFVAIVLFHSESVGLIVCLFCCLKSVLLCFFCNFWFLLERSRGLFCREIFHHILHQWPDLIFSIFLLFCLCSFCSGSVQHFHEINMFLPLLTYFRGNYELRSCIRQI